MPTDPVDPFNSDAPLAKKTKLDISNVFSQFTASLNETGFQIGQHISAKPNKKQKYHPGQHGSRKSEQRRLSTEFKTEISGETHESEHTIGFEVLNRTTGFKRGTKGTARILEQIAPAYQEVKALHRAHIGTGSRPKPDASGFNSQRYRDTQRRLILAGDISSAVQINQLGYAFDPAFKNLPAAETALRAANSSYDVMVANMGAVTYAGQVDGDSRNIAVAVTAEQQAEMFLARRAAKSGVFPTIAEENAARIRFGLAAIGDTSTMMEVESGGPLTELPIADDPFTAFGPLKPVGDPFAPSVPLDPLADPYVPSAPSFAGADPFAPFAPIAEPLGPIASAPAYEEFDPTTLPLPPTGPVSLSEAGSTAGVELSEVAEAGAALA